MSYDQAAMAVFAAQVVADCNGRTITPEGVNLNMDRRYGYQCMDLFIYIRYQLGYRDNLPTPDAASVWELPDTSPLWSVFARVTPDQPANPGDIGVMNRTFFNNGVGHIFMIVADLGTMVRVLELNGTGDGREDDAGNQYGSPARVHDWPKTCLYGYLRWTGPTPGTPTTLEDILATLQDKLMTGIDGNPVSVEDQLRSIDSKASDSLATARQALDLIHGFLAVSIPDPTDPAKSYTIADYIVWAATNAKIAAGNSALTATRMATGNVDPATIAAHLQITTKP